MKLHLNFYYYFLPIIIRQEDSIGSLTETMQTTEKETNVNAIKNETKSANQTDEKASDGKGLKNNDSVNSTPQGAMKDMNVAMAAGNIPKTYIPSRTN